MKHPIQIIKILGILLLLTLFFLSGALTVQAAPPISLTKMEKQENINRTKLTFYFSELPKFETDHSGQRVDLLLPEVLVSAKLNSLPEDEAVVKILLAEKYRELLVSILLRRPPQRVVTESLADPARVVMELFWGKEQGSRTGVAFGIADMPPRKAGKKARDFSRKSPWQGRWREFFRDYRSDWTLTLAESYSLPPLPELVTDPQSPLRTLQVLAAEQKWLSLLRAAGALNGLDEQQQSQRDLLIAEAQLRRGALAAGLATLEQVREAPAEERFRVEYLTAYAQAGTGQPYVALLTLQELLADLPVRHLLAAPVSLLAAETALAAEQAQLALSYLQNPELFWPESLLTIQELRGADALAGLGELEQALARYWELVEAPGLCDFYLESCNRAAFCAFKLEEYPLASRLYRKLTDLAKDQPKDDLLWFATGSATYAAGDLKWGLITLQKTVLERPASEGGGRAALRLIDHRFLNEGELGMAQAVAEYGHLGETSVSREVREEASLKQAIAQYLLGDHADSVQNLMRFRREFASAGLRREADLLLLEQLPPLIGQLLEQKNELPAVVLVEQNRDLLLHGGLSRDFLRDLAAAFERLGLYARAGRALLYLFDQSAAKAQQKPIYLPLARSYLKSGNYAEASDFAGRYLEKYPQGEDRGAIFEILLDAFAAQGRNDDLLAWLNRKNRPTSPALEIRAAWIYWEQQKFPELIRCLELAKQGGGELEVKEMALLAEAYFQLNRNDRARQVYQQLQSDPRFGTQARYRSAQLLLRGQQPGEALNLLTRLVDEGNNDPWGKLARDLLLQIKQ